MLKLKLDEYIKRTPERSTREANIPKLPLTEDQIKQMLDVNGDLYKKCIRAYVNRMRASALLSNFDEPRDLPGEAYLFMWNILNKFDLSKCGPISEWDVEGKLSPKTIDFYFYNYFSMRVNLAASEARDWKQKRGIGPADSLSDLSYDPSDEGNLDSKYIYKHDITGEIFAELDKKSFEFKRFFVQTFRMQFTQRDLREEYGDKFPELRKELDEFVSELRKKI